MTGYLQRLANSAVRTEQRVQPVVGSLFTRQRVQPLEENATTMVSGPGPGKDSSPMMARLAAAEVSPGAAKMPEMTGLGEVEMRVEDSKRVEMNGTAKPFRVEKLSSDTRQGEPIAKAKSSEQREKEQRGQDMLRGLSEFMERPAELTASSSGGVPRLVEDTGGSTEAGELGSDRSRYFANGVPSQRVAGPQAARTQTSPIRSGGDDIQINIGRIEVIAVAQQDVQRPTAAPVRRGPSLSEYLQRRDRRTR